MDEKGRELAENEEGANGVAGATAGLGAGGVLGTVMGAAVAGPVGMLLGGGIGTVIGAAVGYAIDYDSHQPEFLEHHNVAHTGGRHTFDQASPAYRYGWESHDHPDFYDETYDKIRPALQQGWTGSSDFADYEDYVKHGWERRAASKQLGSFSTAAKS